VNYLLARAWLPSAVPFFLTDVPALSTVIFLAGLFGGTSANLPTDPTSDTNGVWVP